MSNESQLPIQPPEMGDLAERIRNAAAGAHSAEETGQPTAAAGQHESIELPAQYEGAHTGAPGFVEKTPLASVADQHLEQGAPDSPAKLDEPVKPFALEKPRTEPPQPPTPPRQATPAQEQTTDSRNFFMRHKKASGITAAALAAVGITFAATRGGGHAEHAANNGPAVTQTHANTGSQSPTAEVSGSTSASSQAELAELQTDPSKLSLAFFDTLSHDKPDVAYGYLDQQNSLNATANVPDEIKQEWKRVAISFEGCTPLLSYVTDTYEDVGSNPSVEGLTSKSYHYFVQGNDANYSVTIITSQRDGKWWVEESYWKPTTATNPGQLRSPEPGSINQTSTTPTS